MLQIRETWTNQTEGYHCGDSDWYEPFTEDRGRLFRSLQREHGRCTSRVYRDAPRTALAAGFGAVGSAAVGWYFEQRRRYGDSKETFLAGTWVEIRS